MTVEPDDLGRYFAEITERRRAEVAAAAEQIAQAKADEAVVVAEIEQQAHAAITTAVERAGEAEGGQRGWSPQQQSPQDESPAAFMPLDDTDDEETWPALSLPQSPDSATRSVRGTSASFDVSAS